MFLPLFILSSGFLLFFFLARGINRQYTDSILKKRQRKKLKYTDFWDWILYRKHYDVLPKSRLVWYFSLFLQYFIAIAVVIVCNFIPSVNIGPSVVTIYYTVNTLLFFGADMGMF